MSLFVLLCNIVLNNQRRIDFIIAAPKVLLKYFGYGYMVMVGWLIENEKKWEKLFSYVYTKKLLGNENFIIKTSAVHKLFVCVFKKNLFILNYYVKICLFLS